METILNDAEIHRISTILSSDTEAVEQKEKIYGSLKLPQGDLQDLKQAVLNDRSGAYGFFKTALLKYSSKTGALGTVNSLIDRFTELNLINVVEEIRGVEKAASKVPGVWFNVDAPVQSFTGRETELENLHKLVTRKTGFATVINQISTVSGLGGIGKSQLAKKYAWTYCAYYQGNAIWINAETKESFRNSVYNLLKKHFNISDKEPIQKTNNELMEVVYERFTDQKCLIILDNVEGFDVINTLPTLGPMTTHIPNILITSRNSKWDDGIEALELGVLSVEEAVEFVHKRIRNNTNTEAVVQLVKILQRLPLALQQAIAYIRAVLSNTENPVQTYLQLFNSEYERDLLDYTGKPFNANEKTTYATWTVTLKNIETQQHGILAIRIMKLISCFQADGIPECLFEHLKSRPKFGITLYFSRLEANTESTFEVKGAIALLDKYSMITGAHGVISVHRLVQRVVKLNMGQNIKNILMEGLDLLENYISPKSNVEPHDLVKSILPHAESLWRQSLQYKELVRKYAHFPSNICDYQRRYGRYAAMLELARESKSEIETVLGEENKHTIRIKLKEKEAVSGLRGEAEDSTSLEIFKEILSIAKVKFGNDLEPTLLELCDVLWKNLRQLGNQLQELNLIEEILAILRNVYEVGWRVLRPEHQDTLNAGSWKDEALRKKEMLIKVNEIIQKLEEKKRFLGDFQSDTVKAMRSREKQPEKHTELKTSYQNYSNSVSILNEEEIYRISCILSSDADAVAMREHIYGMLGLPLADLPDSKQRILFDQSGCYGFFSESLLKYRGMQGSLATVNRLIDCFSDLNLISVVEAIRSNLNPALKSIWFGIEHPVASFTGRTAEVSKLHELATRNVKSINQISVVCGLGGIGKSELAKTYAWKYYDYYQGNVIWINAETKESFRNSVYNLLKKHFNVFEKESIQKTNYELMEEVYERFADQKCLIILDNVEHFDVINTLPTLGPMTSQIPNILITSRNSKWGDGIEALELGVLSVEEAVELVNKRIPNNTNTEAVIKLVKILQCLPLALQQAIAYIRAVLSTNENPVQTYLQSFNSENEKNLLDYTNDEPLNTNEKTTYTTWTLTLKNIETQQHGILAIRIMKLISSFEADGIPECLFEHVNVKSRPNFPKIGTTPTLEVKEAIALLDQYSMITGARGLLNVHRLVQRVVKLKMGEKFMNVLIEGLDLLGSFISPKADIESHDLVKSILPHAESIWRHSMQYKELVRKYAHFPSNICDYQRRYGRYAAMLELARDSKSQIEDVWGKENEHTIRIKFKEAQALYSLGGQVSTSLKILKELLSTSNVQVEDDHDLPLEISNYIMLNLKQQGKHEEELKIIEQILTLQTNKYGTEHSETLTVLHNKALVLYQLKRSDESMKLLWRVYEVRRKVLGDEPQSTLKTRNYIAYIFVKEGRWQEAIKLLKNL